MCVDKCFHPLLSFLEAVWYSVMIIRVYRWDCNLFLCWHGEINIFFYCAAPAQPPLNIEWTLIGSQLSLYWEPVVAMDSESEVTGYQVSSFVITCLLMFRIRRRECSGSTNAYLHCVSCLVSFLHSAFILETETQRGKHAHNSQFNSGADPPRERQRLYHSSSDAEWRRTGSSLGSHSNPQTQ